MVLSEKRDIIIYFRKLGNLWKLGPFLRTMVEGEAAFVFSIRALE